MDNDIVKKTAYDKLLLKFNATDTVIPSASILVTKTQYDPVIQHLGKRTEDGDKKIPNGMLQKTNYNARITEIENKVPNKIPNVNNLATKAALKTKAPEFENKMTDINSWPTKATFNKKATEIGKKTPDTTGFMITVEFKRSIKISFDAIIKRVLKKPC